MQGAGGGDQGKKQKGEKHFEEGNFLPLETPCLDSASAASSVYVLSVISSVHLPPPPPHHSWKNHWVTLNMKFLLGALNNILRLEALIAAEK